MSLLFDKISPIKIIFFILNHKKCHECGSTLVGNGEGHFELTEKGFKRECKCGASVQTGFCKS
ncbi:DUF3797 domain-containing protein [Lysinibacillus fusiformis]|uniref:DUF3797 domain-containing protein n=1 Tax=Lysinibacillus fusiformis TaxID=28031 RepID=UPI0005034C42|nr:DUF3797 domain-containing protein [Lysinibacillus fusiformis]KGA83646.1 hypothetical protein KQ41_06250 [Lysinibacillus fusiformis]UXJ71329.1 DUF3797 domain-containing protein [Lysinibacillus fusiformis]